MKIQQKKREMDKLYDSVYHRVMDEWTIHLILLRNILDISDGCWLISQKVLFSCVCLSVARFVFVFDIRLKFARKRLKNEFIEKCFFRHIYALKRARVLALSQNTRCQTVKKP